MSIIDSKSLVKKFHKFFEEYKKKEIKQAINEDLNVIKLSFSEISEFDFELGDKILANPQEAISIIEETLKQFYEDEDTTKFLKVRFTSLPITEQLMIRDIRSEHLGKLVMLEGLVRRKTDVRPRLQYLEYLCTNPSCNFSESKLKIPQLEDKARTLKTCPKCKSSVELVNKVLLDSQNLILEEIPEQLDNSSDQPKRINVLLQDDLVSPFKDSKTNPGSRVYVIGLVKEIPIATRTGAESINYDLIVEGNHIDLTEDDYSEIKISKEEEKEIKELAAKDDVMEILVKNTAPSIYGNNRIKEAVLLQVFGGCGGTKGDGVKTRGNIHMLLLGDPGAAKSQLLKAASKIAPKSMFVSGKSASAAGLTATVMKDELTKGWALEAGAMVLANGGLCAIDELDKMSDEDTSAMHEALEQQTISIAKANIRATLRCETTVLGAANPKYGRFDPYGDIMKQIDFPPALVSRFDLIFIIRDIPDKKRDDLIADHILNSHRDTSKTIPDISTDFLKKYVAFTKKIKPVLTQEAIDKIRNYYVAIRNATGEDDNGVKSVPITARQLEAIVRLAEAYAKIKLDKKVRGEHAQLAIDLLMYCLEKIGIDPRTGQLDIDKITSGVTASTRNIHKIIIQIIEKLETEKPEIMLEDILEEATKVNITKPEVQKMLDKLKQDGIIFEPRKNTFKKLP
ncbi:MAG: minichromosome maintenance protein MCM [Candidatus Woesearchaeota archaeon]|jgi:replicative DNA helicase Mcm|nr:minichromosome maintenance protein MCM [Candidatus Woesearchaeota archaeon]